MPLVKTIDIKSVPFRGGAVTAIEKALLPFGGYSLINNLRNDHPGFRKRAGMAKLHTTADNSNSVLSLFQFSKTRVDESHFYAQMTDGDVLEATTAPPGVTTGAFGSAVFETGEAWLGTWAYRIKVIIDKDQFDDSLTHYPIAIEIGASVGQDSQDLTEIFDELTSDANRKKIAVTKSDGETQLYVEIEDWDDANEKATLWVSKSDFTVASDTDTILYLYFDSAQSDNDTYIGDSGDAVAQNVWDSSFELVMHMAQDPTGGSDAIKDSTSNGNHGTCSNLTAGDLQDATVGKCLNFDGAANERLEISDDDSLSFGDAADDEAMTQELFVNMDDPTTFRMLEKRDTNIEYLTVIDGSDNVNAAFYDLTTGNYIGRATAGGSETGRTGWIYYAVTYAGDGAMGSIDIWRDATEIDTANYTAGSYTAMHNTTESLYIGCTNAGNDSADGRISEVRISREVRSDAWLNATVDVLNDDTNTYGSSEAYANLPSGTQIPASWSVLSDILIFSNGVDQHQIYGGTGSYIDKLVYFDGAAAPTNVPELGKDFSVEVTDGRLTTYAEIDSLDTYANFECLFFKTPVPCDGLTFTIKAANSTVSVASLHYWNGSWVEVSDFSDGTASGGATLAQDGTMSFTAPTDILTKYMYGANGFWYQLRVTVQLDAAVEISAVKYTSDWQDLINVWDGIPVYAVEVQVEGSTQFEVYGAAAVDLDTLAASKKIMIASTDPIEGIYIDPGGTPNATGTALTSLKYWDGTALQSVGTVTDGTSGMSNAGWLTFPRQSDVMPMQFGGSSVYAYWYELIWDSQLSADVNISIEVMPYFDIDEFGQGYCNTVWKDRAVYSFDLWGAYLYLTASNQPMVLNGTDFGILKAGDGRANKIVSMRRFHNELIVFQEEKGVDGGCVTLFEGYSPETFGKLLLSARLGSMNNNCVCVVDGVLTSTATDETIKTLVFFLSRYGVCVTDGRTISIISDDIRNYFDPTKPECIRRGKEMQMWLAHDTAYNVIRVGLVSGQLVSGTDIAFADTDPDTITSATIDFTDYGVKAGMIIETDSDNNPGPFTVSSVSGGTITLISSDSLVAESAGSFIIYPASPNVFPVFDLVDKVWSFDDPAQTLRCQVDVEAESGNVPVVQVGGGVGDGFVYLLNTGTNDVSTAIDGYAIMELAIAGFFINLRRFLIRMKAQASGDLDITLTKNDIAAATKTLSMIAENSGQTFRRHIENVNITDQLISIKFQNDGASEELKLLDTGFNASIWTER